ERRQVLVRGRGQGGRQQQRLHVAGPRKTGGASESKPSSAQGQAPDVRPTEPTAHDRRQKMTDGLILSSQPVRLAPGDGVRREPPRRPGADNSYRIAPR